MTVTAGIDVGSTYTKVVIHDGETILAKTMSPTGFRLREIAAETFDRALDESGMGRDDVAYVIATGIGRHQVDFKDTHVTDLTASSRGAGRLFPGTRTILDIGGQTMKATRVDEPVRFSPSGSTTNVPPAPGPSSRRRPGTWATPPRRLDRSCPPPRIPCPSPGCVPSSPNRR